MRLKRRCDHEWQTWWEWELDVFLGKADPRKPRFLALNGERSVRYCPKCGAVEDYIFVPTEEESAFDKCCWHIRRDEDGMFMRDETE